MLDLNSLPLPRLFEELTTDGNHDRLLDAGIAEDLRPPGDITTQSIIEPGRFARAEITARIAGVAAGVEILPAIAARFGSIDVDVQVADGTPLEEGASLASLRGELAKILGAERIILNVLTRLSGIATLTRQYVEVVAGSRCLICDTRKTTPGMRALEKYAVRCGGGHLHRIGLFDAALFKDNHLAGIPQRELGATLASAIRTVRRRHEVRFVEIEVDTIEQLHIVLSMEQAERGLVDIVLLDNMPDFKLLEAVQLRNQVAPRVLLECSGGVTLGRLPAIAATGVDRVSVGALTHSAVGLDIGLDIHE